MKKRFPYCNPINAEEMTIFGFYILFLSFQAEKNSLIQHRHTVKLNPLPTYCISSGHPNSATCFSYCHYKKVTTKKS